MNRSRRLVPLLAFAALAAHAGATRAAIYTWTDASGNVNVSNLAPPDGALGVRVAPDLPPTPSARTAPSLDALAARIRELEAEVAAKSAAAPVAPPQAQVIVPAVVVAQAPPTTIVVQAPAPAEPSLALAASAACAAGWTWCEGYWGSPFATPVVVVQSGAPSRRPGHEPPRFAPPPPSRVGAPWAMIRPLMP